MRLIKYANNFDENSMHMSKRERERETDTIKKNHNKVEIISQYADYNAATGCDKIHCNTI